MAEYYWDDKIDYLMKTRLLYYNDDYLQFLVERVWRISSAVNVIDFGCGYGFLGLKLLPLLPGGSTYTGIDKGEDLTAKGGAVFSQLSYTVHFVTADVLDYRPEQKYDIAFCHAFLLHMADPIHVIEKMRDTVKPGGMVVCIEPYWLSSMAHFLVGELQQSRAVRVGILQKLYDLDAERTGRDGNIGMKLPLYLSQAGLVDVGSRVSDKVNYLSPSLPGDERQVLYESLCAEGFANPPGEIENYVTSLVGRGLTEAEARELHDSEQYLTTTFGHNGDAHHVLFAPTMMISYGTVR